MRAGSEVLVARGDPRLAPRRLRPRASASAIGSTGGSRRELAPWPGLDDLSQQFGAWHERDRRHPGQRPGQLVAQYCDDWRPADTALLIRRGLARRRSRSASRSAVRGGKNRPRHLRTVSTVICRPCGDPRIARRARQPARSAPAASVSPSLASPPDCARSRRRATRRSALVPAPRAAAA